MRLVGKHPGIARASPFVAAALAGVCAFAPAGGARAVEWGAGLDAGYAFRSASGGTNHGALASAFVDAPLPGPFAVRPEVLSLEWNRLAFLGGAASLVYAFDDASVQALASFGPLAGVGVVDQRASFQAGILASLSLRVPILDAVSVEARVSVPAIVYGPEGFNSPGQQTYASGVAVPFPFVAAFSGGVVFDLGALVADALH